MTHAVQYAAIRGATDDGKGEEYYDNRVMPFNVAAMPGSEELCRMMTPGYEDDDDTDYIRSQRMNTHSRSCYRTVHHPNWACWQAK